MPEGSLAARLRLYLVADPDHVQGDLTSIVEAGLRGGVTSVQLRCKGRSDREYLALAKAIRQLANRFGALFLVNDRVDIALASQADGVHVGVDDLPIEDVRRISGSALVIGFSPETDRQTALAAERGASYLGVGPVFGTATKPDAGKAIGLETIKRRAKLAGIPIIGIGGVTAENARSVVCAGAVGVAVASAVTMADDGEAAARRLAMSLQS